MKIDKKGILKVLGDISLIVVGILLALQIENWNDDRKTKEFARDTLIEIKSSLEADSEHIKSRIKRLQSISNDMATISSIANLTEENTTDSNELLAQVSQSFPSLASYIVLELNTSSYETLKNTGLNIVEDSKLRFKLVGLYDYSYSRINWMIEKEFNKPTEDDYWPVFNKYVTYQDKADDGDHFIANVTDVNKLLKDSSVINAARQKYNKSQSMIERLGRLGGSIDSLIVAIERYL